MESQKEMVKEAKMETGVVEVLSEGVEEHKSSYHYAQTALFTIHIYIYICFLKVS